MFRSILIANRGEIAVRIIRACRNMGIKSIAVYSKEDKDSLHVQLADRRVCIGEGPAKNSYLNMERIISAAKNTDADAIHPGFGFLSENADFVRLCKENGIAFIGPSAEVIDSMGNKSNARKTMMEAGVPVIIDDRAQGMLGAKIKDCYMFGTPYMLVLGNKAQEGSFEIESTKTGEKKTFTEDELIEEFVKMNNARKYVK